MAVNTFLSLKKFTVITVMIASQSRIHRIESNSERIFFEGREISMNKKK